MKQVAGAVTPLSVDAHATLLQLSCVCHLTRPFRHRQLRPSFALFVRSVKGSSHTHTHTHTERGRSGDGRCSQPYLARWPLLARPQTKRKTFVTASCYTHTHTHLHTHLSCYNFLIFFVQMAVVFFWPKFHNPPQTDRHFLLKYANDGHVCPLTHCRNTPRGEKKKNTGRSVRVECFSLLFLGASPPCASVTDLLPFGRQLRCHGN